MTGSPTSIFPAQMVLSLVHRNIAVVLSLLTLALSSPTVVGDSCHHLDGPSCSPRRTGSEVVQDDVGLEPAVDFIQKAMWGKKKDVKVEEKPSGPTSPRHVHQVPAADKNESLLFIGGSSHLDWTADPCAIFRSHDDELVPPLVPDAGARLLVLRELGLAQTTSVRHCQAQRTAGLDSLLPAKTVEEKNKLAFWLMVVWCIFVVLLIVWSMWSIIIQPRKPEVHEVHAKKLNLADEDTAWRRGFVGWASLTWADDLMGRYGKCLNAVIDDRELIEDRMDEEFMPYVRFKKYWEEEVRIHGMEAASLFKPLMSVIGVKAAAGLVFAIAVETFMSNVGMVIALDKFLGHLEHLERQKHEHPEEEQSYLEATLMIILYIFGVPMVFRTATIVVHLLDGYYTNVCAAGIGSIVFEKAMQLPVGASPPEADEDQPDGYYEQNMRPNLVQLLNVDIIECWGYLLKTIVYMMVVPFIFMILLVMLVLKIRVGGLCGVAYIVPCTVVTLFGVRFNIRAWIKYQGFQDERLRWLTETIVHIRTIKSLAWEKLSFERLHKVRLKELEQNQACGILGGVISSLGHTAPWGTLLIACGVTLATQGFLEAHTIIIIQRIMDGLLHAMTVGLTGAHKFITVPNSFKRIRKFLFEHDLPKDVVHPPPILGPDAHSVKLSGSFSYVKGKPVLYDMDVSFAQGEFVAVIGAVASGKSAFLQTILGELYAVEDAFVQAPTPGSKQVAYCAQVPWIFEGTLRENVLLNRGLDKQRYFQSLFAAGLLQDLETLPGGDQVTIGSYGVRLSGGQRARVALARAVYQEESRVVVLDDPFASVDMPTGQHICDELLLGPLLKQKTRIVAMQPNPQKLKAADRVLLLEAGRVAACGTPAEVMATEAFKDLMAKSDKAQEFGSTVQVATEGTKTEDGGARTERLCEKKGVEVPSILREQELQDHVTTSTCVWWLRNAGFHNLGFFFVVMALARWVGLWEALAVARWVDAKVLHDVRDMDYIWYIIGVVAANCALIVLLAYAGTRVMMSCSTNLHSKVVQAILRAPVDKFFDKQPVGRLINRLSFDMRRVDDAVLGTLTQLLGFVVGFIVTESFILRILPLKIALMAMPVFAASFFFIYIFRGTTVPLVFHTKFALSMVQDLQATVLSSCASIRANSMFDAFMQRFNHYSHSVIRCNYLVFHICACWVQSRVFLCFSALTCLFACGGLWANVPMGTLATVISQQYAQMTEFEGLSAGFTMFLNILNALQRLTKYFECPQEAPEYKPHDIEVRKRAQVSRQDLVKLEVRASQSSSFLVCVKGGDPLLRSSPDGAALVLCEGRHLTDLAPSCKALQEIKEEYTITGVNSVSRQADQMAQELCNPSAVVWIDLWHAKFSEGMRIQIESLTAGYASEKNVLHGISVDILPRMKMGFAGKTGCGKSTTMLCLLRLLEPRSGRVLMGGVNASELGLATLRQIVGLVPQDPTIFEGTIRSNIDPFDEYPDARIWECLRSMRLLSWVRQQPGGIRAPVAKEGGNMSFGQRQLLSLARMVIRQPPVLLLDECTSALDPNTQQVVQDTILHEFPMTTVIAIAHRVETILDFDRVTVLDAGSVAEHGSIQEVLQIEKGIFADMVRIAKPAAMQGSLLGHQK